MVQNDFNNRTLMYETAEQFRASYNSEYLIRLHSFLEDCCNTLYTHYYNNGKIKFPINKPDVTTTIGQLIFAKKCVTDMLNTDFLYYDIMSKNEKICVQDGFYLAEMNMSRMGKTYGY